MKYYHYGILALLAVCGLWGGVSKADCQTLHFSNGDSICADIVRTGTDRFELKTSGERLGQSTGLNCSLLLPNQERAYLPRCRGNFSYAGSDMKIELRADTDQSYAVLIVNYDFSNGRFYDGNQSNNNQPTPSHNYQLEFQSVSTSNPASNQWIDMTLRARYNGSSSASDFEGSVQFSVEQYRNGRWEAAYSSDYELERSHYDFSSSDRGERRFPSLLRLKSAGEFRIIAKSNRANTTASYSFHVSGNTDTNWNPPRNADVRIERVSNRSPYMHEWVDVAVNIQDGGNVERRVYFRVEQYIDGRWKLAYSSDYELERSSFYFARGESFRRFPSLLKFRNHGRYKLVVELDNGNVDYQVFDVNYDRNNRRDDRRDDRSNETSAGAFSIYAFSPNHPSSYEWVDMTVKVYDRAGYLNEHYRNYIRIEVDRLEGNYRRRASSADYDLRTGSLRFERSDRGQKRFDDVIRFRADGEYRIKVSDERNSNISTTRTIVVGRGQDRHTQNSSFTDQEYRKIKAVYEIWHSVIASLRKDYPKLRNSTRWQELSDRFYADMGDVIYAHRNATFTSWSVFYGAFQEWFGLTVRTR